MFSVHFFVLLFGTLKKIQNYSKKSLIKKGYFLKYMVSQGKVKTDMKSCQKLLKKLKVWKN
jgi:hypothetical protein